MLAPPTRPLVALLCALVVASCQEQSLTTGLIENPQPPLHGKGLFNGPAPRGIITFQSDRNGNFDLFEKDLGNDFVRQLTTSTADDRSPYWWTRGRVLLFDSDRTGNRDVHTLDVASGAVARLTSSPATDEIPSGQRDLVAFASDRDGDFDIYLMDPATGFTRQLTADPAPDHQPDLSPDARYVVFSSGRSGSGTDLWMMEIETGELTQLTEIGFAVDAAFSPSGRQIAFQGGFDVFTFDLRDGTLLRLTSFLRNLTPAWSPNGDFIAFSSNRDGDYDIYVIHVESGALAQITNDPSDELYPTWRR